MAHGRGHGVVDGLGGLLWIAFWGSVIYLIVTLVRRTGPSAPAVPEDPVAVLKQRYARGEIDRDEHERMRHDLAV